MTPIPTFVSLENMKKRSFLRVLMVAAGILAAVTIVVSPAFQQEAERMVTELKADAGLPDEGTQLAAVSSDAVTSPQAVQVEPANPFTVQEVIAEGERPSRFPVPDISLPVQALTKLLRTVISPQAP